MQKELNPELFGERKITKNTTGAGATSGGAGSGMTSMNGADWLATDRQMMEIRSQIHQIVDQMNKMSATVNEYMKNTSMRMERFQQQLARLEQSHNGLAQESGQKIAQVNLRLQEKKALDLKVQEMLDRHNTVVRSFEVRMNHLQKLLAEKEAQTQAAQMALNETKMELARLKRL